MPKPEDIFLVIDRDSISDEKDDISRLIDSAETASMRAPCLPSPLPAEQYQLRFLYPVPSRRHHLRGTNRQHVCLQFPIGCLPYLRSDSGSVIGIDEKLVIPNTSMSLYDGCVVCWRGEKMGMWLKEFIRRAEPYNFPIFKPYSNSPRRRKTGSGMDCLRTRSVTRTTG